MNRFASGSVMVRGFPVTFKAAAAETASTTHATIDTASDGGSIAVQVKVTASSGTTPTLTVVVEGSNDGGTTWVGLGTIGANGYLGGTVGTSPSNITGAVTVNAVFPRLGLVRTRSVVGGTTPSFTYAVTGVVC